MKVVCIDDSRCDGHLSIGDEYEVVHVNELDNRYIIQFDLRVRGFSGTRFITVSELRNKKIEKILE